MATATTPNPATPTPLLASLAAALHSGGADRARVFAELSEEALVLCEQAPSEQLWLFWLSLSETFQHLEQQASKAVTA